MGNKGSSATASRKDDSINGGKDDSGIPLETACLGAGCYWGTEKFFRNHNFENGSIVDVKVGFMGGTTKNPSYRQVCSGTTGHVEVAEIKFTGGGKMYGEMLRHFFSFHDPTTLDQQGNDRGTQYASVIFTYSDVQRQIAQATISSLQKSMNEKGHQFRSNKVATQVRDAEKFYPAHEEHQQYLAKNRGGYCNHKFYISKWPGDIELSPDLVEAQTSA
eukprot:CAMPEP_0197326168 /NCGR_PEP_ID=MMETSP0892-20130614/1431_1 /TAXON_ID=44058 ORGANISM="Aureoumbra lagunensis, Strain CCMP1510" /NCGR_SAMPLE_ID=MMETSP0892 /ASSEMBLY_ACC=CAM_ASM_000538 /LENGTH=217 /DNA_ID=CAMNT_0042820087 /DNA_START=71 /DNA_END=724 /DNA_ORIENTATION=+